MKKTALFCSFLLMTASVFAAEGDKKPSPAQVAQQEKMKDCNAQANGKKGDERKAFMKGCLSNKPAGEMSPQAKQQEKMKTCNKDASAKNLKGDDRKKFMSGCLKG